MFARIEASSGWLYVIDIDPATIVGVMPDRALMSIITMDADGNQHPVSAPDMEQL
jgi:hypothetical protein